MTLDLETQTHKFLKRKASPWHPDNYIVAHGWKVRGDTACSWRYNDGPVNQELDIPDDVDLLVGFNLKFDLTWMWEDPQLKAFFKRGGKIWDCQYAEYLLHGQQPEYQYANLNDTAPKYGGTSKVDAVKVLWEQGVQTSDIDPDMLIDYLVGTEEEERNAGDIGNTEKVFLGQYKKAKEMGMLKAIWSRMDGLCATTEMEFNGLKIDINEAKAQYKKLKSRRNEIFDSLQQYVPELPPELEFNWGSRTHKSCLIFGGTVKYKKRDTYIDEKTGELARLVATEKWPLFDGEPVDPSKCRLHEDLYYILDCKQDTFKSGKQKGLGKFKNVRVQGELKQKYQDFFYTFKGYTDGQDEWKTKSTDGAGNSLYSTSGDTIGLLANTGVPFCEALAEYEALEKEINTYFITSDGQSGMLTCVDKSDNKIHHGLNHVATVTSRLSSSDPNLQNVPRGDKSEIKRLFHSRFREKGLMLEADYSQLEVVVQGVLSGDKQLCEDLRNRIDFHCKRVAIQPKYKKSYDEVVAIIGNEEHPDYDRFKSIRTKAKIFSFQRAYGAGASLIAISTGMPVDDVKALIEAEDATYPGVKKFNDKVEYTVKEGAESFADYSTGVRKIYRRGYWTAPTGCIYSFRSYEAQDWQKERGIEDSFSPTELKNYPIQGTGGEIVQGICGRLWRHFVENENYGGRALLCNTVHDCIWVDLHEDVKDEVATDIKRIMESVDDWFKQFGVEITVPFPVEVEVGPNMLELKHY